MTGALFSSGGRCGSIVVVTVDTEVNNDALGGLDKQLYRKLDTKVKYEIPEKRREFTSKWHKMKYRVLFSSRAQRSCARIAVAYVERRKYPSSWGPENIFCTSFELIHDALLTRFAQSYRHLSKVGGQASAPHHCKVLEYVRPVLVATVIYAGDEPWRRSARPETPRSA